MKSHQHINQDSGNTEYYTDPKIIEAARRTMGGIDLDPASSPRANEVVRAKAIYTKEDNGLSRAWRGRVWMNHPFDRRTNRLWIAHLKLEHDIWNMTQACCITYAATSERWFRPLLDYPQCFLVPRTNYYLPDGTIKKGVTKGSVVTYLGPNVDRFKAEFSKLGVVKIVA